MSEGRTEVNHYLYRHFAADGSLLYVGISLCAIQRLAQHRFGSNWFSEIREVRITAYPTRADALAAERDAIKGEKPLHNVMLMDGKRRHRSMTQASMAERIEAARVEAAVKLARFEAVYDERAFAEVLGIGETAARKLLDSGEIQFLEVPQRRGNGTVRRITGWALIDWLESTEQKGK